MISKRAKLLVDEILNMRKLGNNTPPILAMKDNFQPSGTIKAPSVSYNPGLRHIRPSGETTVTTPQETQQKKTMIDAKDTKADKGTKEPPGTKYTWDSLISGGQKFFKNMLSSEEDLYKNIRTGLGGVAGRVAGKFLGGDVGKWVGTAVGGYLGRNFTPGKGDFLKNMGITFGTPETPATDAAVSK